MADKKISALTQVSNSDIGGDDLLHIVDNPGGTPVNKKMTITQLFEHIPVALCVDSFETVSTTGVDITDEFVTVIDASGASADLNLDLADPVDKTGKIKVIFMKTAPNGSYVARITVDSWGYSTDTTEQIIVDGRGQAVVLIWDGVHWNPIANLGTTLS